MAEKAEAPNDRERLAALERDYAEMRALAYGLAHELGQPLLALEIGLRAIAEDPSPAALAARRESMGHLIATMRRQVADLLELGFAHPEARPASGDAGSVDLTACAEAVVRELRRSRPRAVAVTIARGMTAPGAPRLWRLIVQNLIANAWVHAGAHGSPRIEVCMAEGRGLRVADNGEGYGPGSARDDAPGRPGLGPASGYGYGLRVVERACALLSGQLAAEPRPGGGTVFSVRFPAAPPAERAIP